MKTNTILSFLFAMLGIVSCNKVMDKQNLQTMPYDIAFGDSSVATLNLDYIYYLNLPSWGGSSGVGGLDGLHPELSEESYDGTGANKYTAGTITTADVTDFGTSLSATNSWGKINTINMFMRDVNLSDFPQHTKNKLIAQALFWRAWRYFDMVRIYGGVPIILNPMNAVGQAAKDSASLPRNSTSDCIKQMTADLDTAIKYLPGKYASNYEWGRITSGAAAAFKGRILLTYASPEFNPNDLPERWQAAYDANLQAKTLLDANGYGLNASYQNMWFTEVGNPEAVMVTSYNTSNASQQNFNNTYDNGTRPSYMGTAGGSNQPSWEFVKMFPMKDGKIPGDITSKYTYSDQYFYKNRDPRFDNTVAYNGCSWPLNGNTNYKLWTYFVSAKSIESSIGKATNTGFYCRKAIDPNLAISNVIYCGTDWMEIRYSEVLLNLAESAVGINKLGVTDEGYTGLIGVRKRATVEAGTDGMYGLVSNMTRAQLFTAILYERQIEFGFEGKRFWDLRRWKLMESTLNGKQRNGQIITFTPTSGLSATTFAAQRDTMNLDNLYKQYFTLKVNVLDTKYTINWQSTYYFFPIPQAAIDNDPKLIQNNNWGGSFDPLK